MEINNQIKFPPEILTRCFSTPLSPNIHISHMVEFLISFHQVKQWDVLHFRTVSCHIRQQNFRNKNRTGKNRRKTDKKKKRKSFVKMEIQISNTLQIVHRRVQLIKRNTSQLLYSLGIILVINAFGENSRGFFVDCNELLLVNFIWKTACSTRVYRLFMRHDS